MIKRLLLILAKCVPTGTPVRIYRGPLRGLRWIAGAAAGEGRGLAPVLNMAEPAQLAFARNVCDPNAVCLDLGANVGLYTLLFARYCKHVYAFEPSPRNIMYLSRVVEINQKGNVTIVPVAVGASEKYGNFRAGSNCAAGRVSQDGTQPVAVCSCDHFIKNYGVRPTIIKIDVEGAEVDALQGADTLLREYRPTILLSVHGRELRSMCIDRLKQAGYQAFVPLNGPSVERASEIAAFGSFEEAPANIS